MNLESHQYKIRKQKEITESLEFNIQDVDLHKTIIRNIKKTEAEKIVFEYEWLRTFPTYSKFYFGIFFQIGDKEYLGGVLVFSNEHSIDEDLWTDQYTLNHDNTLLLSRGVSLWWTPKNTASFFISRVLKILKSITNYKVITSIVNPKANEVGIIYQALNWYFVSTMDEKKDLNGFCVVINGKHYGSRWFRKKIGTINKEEILKHYPDAKFIKHFKKSRYFYFIGNKRENKFYYNKIKHLIKPYPTKEEFLTLHKNEYDNFIIYKITNQINGKIYIGQTMRLLDKRIKEYQKGGHNPHLKYAFDKYGFDNFTFEIIDECTNIVELNEKEIYWINYYNSTDETIGYNMDSGGKNSERTQETKDKISKSNTGKKKVNRTIFAGTPEAKAVHGKPKTEEEKKYLSEISSGENGYWYGQERTDEVKDKIRQTKLLRGMTYQVCRFDMEKHEIVDVWDSIEYAAKMLGVSPSTINRHCKQEVKIYETPITWRYYAELKEQLDNGIQQENLYEKSKSYKRVIDPLVMKAAFRNRKKVKATNIETKEEVIYDSIMDCAEVFKLSDVMLGHYCKGKFIPKNGYTYEFVTDL